MNDLKEDRRAMISASREVQVKGEFPLSDCQTHGPVPQDPGSRLSCRANRSRDHDTGHVTP